MSGLYKTKISLKLPLKSHYLFQQMAAQSQVSGILPFQESVWVKDRFRERDGGSGQVRYLCIT